MKVSPKKPHISETQTTLAEFLKFYNKNIPEGFPHASESLLKKFKEEHASFFKHGEMWSLDEHRKKIMDWLPLNKSEMA